MIINPPRLLQYPLRGGSPMGVPAQPGGLGNNKNYYR
eukprot:COSAG06_NODE_75801_length_127_cov_751.750000_1_plen_36_part_10